MKRIIDHVEHIKTKPHHIRKKVAMSVATGVTGLVAFVWLGASLATGAFAIQGSSFAESTGQKGTLETVNSGDSQLAGAAAALSQDSGEPRIVIVNVATSSAPVREERDETTIPF